jgi:hypothetical protein
MDARQRRLYERGQRVETFLDANAEDFPADSKGGSLAASVREELAKLSALDVARTAGTSKRQQGTAGRSGVRDTLRQLVTAVSDTARTIALDHPEIKGIFALTGKDRSDRTLIATARAFADAAVPHAGLFAEYGLPAAFISDLRSLSDSLEHYISLQAAGVGTRVNSKASAEESLQRLNELVERLDTVVRNKYRGDPDKLATWGRARRIESAPQSKGNVAGTPTPATNN